MDAALEYLARRQMLERIYDRMTDEERRLFVQMALQNRSTDEILQALQQQSAQIAQVADKVNRQSWLTDFGSDVAANFFTDGLIDVDKVPLAARSVLPDDIVVREAREVDKNFSALHSAKSKIYLYRILRGAASNPFVNRFAWHIFRPLDVEAMREALKILIGTHDFSSFKAASNVQRNPVRTIFAAELFEEKIFDGECLTIKIHASGFLYHMARNIVALTVAAGRKKISLDDFKKIFDAHDRSLVPATAPAQGLCLQEVFY